MATAVVPIGNGRTVEVEVNTDEEWRAIRERRDREASGRAPPRYPIRPRDGQPVTRAVVRVMAAQVGLAAKVLVLTPQAFNDLARERGTDGAPLFPAHPTAEEMGRAIGLRVVVDDRTEFVRVVERAPSDLPRDVLRAFGLPAPRRITAAELRARMGLREGWVR